MMCLWFIMVVMNRFATSRAIFVLRPVFRDFLHFKNFCFSVWWYFGVLCFFIKLKIRLSPFSCGYKRHQFIYFEFLIILTQGRLYVFLIIQCFANLFFDFLVDVRNDLAAMRVCTLSCVVTDFSLSFYACCKMFCVFICSLHRAS